MLTWLWREAVLRKHPRSQFLIECVFNSRIGIRDAVAAFRAAIGWSRFRKQRG